MEEACVLNSLGRCAREGERPGRGGECANVRVGDGGVVKSLLEVGIVSSVFVRLK